MGDVDDTILMSYVDGELDPGTAREVEASLFRDPVRRARVADLRATSALVRAAFHHALYGEPTAAPPPIPAPRWRPSPPAAAAACLLALGVGLAAGLGVGGRAGSPAEARSTALQESLEAHRSGDALEWWDGGETGRITPVSTYRSESGRYCREFEEEHVAGGTARREAGVACREADGRWRVRIRYYP